MSKNYSANTLAYLQANENIVARYLLWIEAKNRGTGATETIGIWTGETPRTFTINGTDRDYVGAGALLSFEPIRSTVGLDVQIHNFTLSGLSNEVEDLIKLYDSRLAPVQFHEAFFNIDDNTLVDEPDRIYKGKINSTNWKTAEEGGTNEVVIGVASSARELTRTIAVFRSHASQINSFPGDNIRKYTALSRSTTVKWGGNLN